MTTFTGHGITVQYGVIPGEKATWGRSGGTPSVPPEITIDEIIINDRLELAKYLTDDVLCNIINDPWVFEQLIAEIFYPELVEHDRKERAINRGAEMADAICAALGGGR